MEQKAADACGHRRLFAFYACVLLNALGLLAEPKAFL